VTPPNGRSQELVALLNPSSTALVQDDRYAATYRPVRRAGEAFLESRQERLVLGDELPVMPLWLPGGLHVAVDLNGTYARTCRAQRIVAGAA